MRRAIFISGLSAILLIIPGVEHPHALRDVNSGWQSTLEELRRELAEAREQQAATAGILAGISNSPTDAHRIFAEIAASAARLCDAYDAGVLQHTGDHLRLVAHHGPIPVHGPIGQATLPLTRGLLLARAVLERQTLHVTDLQAETVEYLEGSEFARRLGRRTVLVVPLIRAGEATGAIFIRRTEIRPFTDRQIDVLKTFADQAVIAIENERLFEAERARTKEVEAKSAELAQSLEYQTAISDVLGVISRSPNDLQRVFDAVAESAAGLCKAQFCHVFRYHGQLIHFAVSHGQTAESIGTMRRVYPIPPGRVSAAARSILTGMVEMIPDIHADPDYGHGSTANYRSIVAVPMLKDGRPIGAICMARSETGDFPERQIEMLRTFADQAVIAIENTRLFEEVQARTRELSESLEYQTATAEVLSVISRSPTHVQPVFDAIASSAAKLWNALDAVVLRVDGDMLRLVAHHGSMPIGDVPLHRGTVGGRAVIERRPIHINDLQAERVEYPEGSAFAKRLGHRTTLSVPLLREGVAIGNIQVRRDEVRPFSDKQIALLQVFADQAVIAIENARLFEEVQARTRELTASLEYQTATSEVLTVISRSPSQLQPVVDTIVQTAKRLCSAERANIWRLRNGKFDLLAHTVTDPALVRYLGENPIPAGRDSLAGRAVLARHPCARCFRRS